MKTEKQIQLSDPTAERLRTLLRNEIRQATERAEGACILAESTRRTEYLVLIMYHHKCRDLAIHMFSGNLWSLEELQEFLKVEARLLGQYEALQKIISL